MRDLISPNHSFIFSFTLYEIALYLNTTQDLCTSAMFQTLLNTLKQIFWLHHMGTQNVFVKTWTAAHLRTENRTCPTSDDIVRDKKNKSKHLKNRNRKLEQTEDKVGPVSLIMSCDTRAALKTKLSYLKSYCRLQPTLLWINKTTSLLLSGLPDGKRVRNRGYRETESKREKESKNWWRKEMETSRMAERGWWTEKRKGHEKHRWR